MVARVKVEGILARHRMLGVISIKERIYDRGSLIALKFVKVNSKTGRVGTKEIECTDLGIITVGGVKARQSKTKSV
jgi:uncharacterized Fe-S cluster-containing protein